MRFFLMKQLNIFLLLIFCFTNFGLAEDLNKKIGQMLMVGFRDLEVNDTSPIKRDIIHYHIGAIILFDYDVSSKQPLRNIQSPNQVKKLVHDLQSLASTKLIIAIDQEGGMVSRLKAEAGFPSSLSAQKIGLLNDSQRTYEHAASIAKILSHLGINMNLAPVVDVNVNPNNPVIGAKERSFSADPKEVTLHAKQFIKAHYDFNILTALKHFPGHGSSEKDSHFGFVDVTKTWQQAELEPYQSLIDKGYADAIMTAHVFNERLDPQYPATLSKRTLSHLLRTQLGWQGVLLSDDLMMGAISEQYTFKMAIYHAIDAGVDILTLANNTEKFDPDITVKTTNAIRALIEEGLITEERINVSYQRIMRLKSRLDKKP